MKKAMDSKTQARYEARAAVFKALAHPSRLLIVDKLSKCEERCVCELTEMVGADMSTVSKHLSILKEAGIVSVEKRGSMVFYRLTVPCITGFFRCVESVMKCQVKSREKALA